MTLKQVLRRTQLDEESVDDLVAGWTVNPVNAAFAKQKVYKERDILRRIAVLEGTVCHSALQVFKLDSGMSTGFL